MRTLGASWKSKTAIALVAASASFSGPSLPVARYIPLFVIERSVNANVVHYDAKVAPDGKLDPTQPVIAYWVMGAEDGRRQDLNLLERTRAYGFSTQAQGMDTYKLTIVSEKTREILVTHEGELARAQTRIGGCRAFLRRIFINTRKSLLLNLAESALLEGVDVATGQACRETVNAGQ